MKKILVIDDNKDNLLTLKALIYDFFSGFEVYTSTSGKEGIELAETHQPDVIFLDILMPDMDGFDVCKLLKKNKSLCEIPVVFVTALKENSANKVRALEVGAEGFLSKPVDENELVVHIKAMLKIKEASDFKKNENQRLEELVLERTNKLKEELRQKREMSKKLIISEKKYRSYIENAPDGVFIVDEKGKYIEVNSAVCQLIGYSEEELLELSITDILLQEDMEIGLQHFNDVKEEGFSSGDTRFKRKDGEVRFWNVAAVKLSDTRFLGYVKDITERKQAEEALKRSEKHSTFLAQTAIDLAVLSSIQEIYSYAVQKLYELLEGNSIVALVGFNQERNRWKIIEIKGLGEKASKLYEILGFDIFNMEGDISTKYYKKITSQKVTEIDFDFQGLFNKKLSAAVGKAVKKLFQIEKLYCISFAQNEHNLGNITFVSNKKTEAINTRLIEAFVQQVSTILKKHKAEEQHKLTEEKIQSVYRVAPTGIGVVEDRVMKEVNPRICEMTGYTREELLGKNARLLYPSEEEYEFVGKEKYDQIRINGTGEVETCWQKKDGSIINVLLASTPIELNDHSKGITFTALDITGRKSIENELKEKTSFLTTIMETSPVGIVTVDKTGKITYANTRAEQILGLIKEEITSISYNAPLWNHTDVDGSPLVEEKQPFNIVKESLNTVFNIQHGITWPDGTEVILSINASPIKDSNGSFNGMIASIEDISDRRKAEEALRQSEEMMRNSQSVAHICSYSTNLNINEIDKSTWVCSPEFYNIFGIDKTYPHTIASWAGFIHPDCREEIVAYHEYVIKKRIPFSRDYKIIRINDGEERWVQGTGKLEFDEKGVPVRMHGAIQDITERKKVEEALAESELKFREMAELLPQIVFESDIQGNLTYVNKQAYKLTGYSEHDSLIGKSTLDFYIPEDRERAVENIKLSLRQKKQSESNEYTMLRKDGTPFNVLVYSSPVLKDNQSIGLRGIIIDISEIKQTEQELIIAREKAEESDRLKSAFLANMSHEMRTPMNGILGFMELLKKPDLTEIEKVNYIDIVNKSGQRLLSTINDIIEISAIESGIIQLSIQEIKLQQLLSYFYDLFLPQAKAKGLQLKMVQCKAAPENIFTDKSKLDSILTNLIKNAIKFTEKGSIEFGCQQTDKNMLLFFVKDSGKGIHPDKIKLIFERFMQGELLLTRDYEGSGLGLSISKAYVEALNGEIWVRSEPGKGSCFYFTIQLTENKVSAPTLDRHEEVGINQLPKKLKLVIAEDDDTGFIYLQEILNTLNFEISRCVNGNEVVDYCQSNPNIDLILMDIKMPGKDGYEATRHIREFNKDVVIIAQTAHAISGDREKAIEAGCNDYISKPINKNDLTTLIQKYFKKSLMD